MSKCVVHWRGKEIKFRTEDWCTWLRIVKILSWVHKRKFPDVTEKMQRDKCEEEFSELGAAYQKYVLDPRRCMLSKYRKEYYYEVADVWLSVSGMFRFDIDRAENYLDRLSSYPIWAEIGVTLMIEKLLEVYFIRTYVNNRHI